MSNKNFGKKPPSYGDFLHIIGTVDFTRYLDKGQSYYECTNAPKQGPKRRFKVNGLFTMADNHLYSELRSRYAHPI